MSSFHAAFAHPIPVFPMLHLKGENADDRFERAQREIDILWASDVDAIIVENYFGDVDDVIRVLDYLRAERPDVVFGLNILGHDWESFRLAREYGARFIQLDSVAGHLPPEDDEPFAQRLADERAQSDILVLGGVRFKYQPVLSGRSVEEDLRLGVQRCDAIVVTGEGTGLITPRDKTEQFRAVVGPDFPLIIGAGVTPADAAAQLDDADGVIVGSALKDTGVDTGDVSAAAAGTFVSAVRALAA